MRENWPGGMGCTWKLLFFSNTHIFEERVWQGRGKGKGRKKGRELKEYICCYLPWDFKKTSMDLWELPTWGSLHQATDIPKENSQVLSTYFLPLCHYLSFSFFFFKISFFFCMYTFPTLTANYLSKRKNKQTNNKHLCFISSFWKNRLLIANLLNF